MFAASFRFEIWLSKRFCGLHIILLPCRWRRLRRALSRLPGWISERIFTFVQINTYSFHHWLHLVFVFPLRRSYRVIVLNSWRCIYISWRESPLILTMLVRRRIVEILNLWWFEWSLATKFASTEIRIRTCPFFGCCLWNCMILLHFLVRLWHCFDIRNSISLNFWFLLYYLHLLHWLIHCVIISRILDNVHGRIFLWSFLLETCSHGLVIHVSAVKILNGFIQFYSPVPRYCTYSSLWLFCIKMFLAWNLRFSSYCIVNCWSFSFFSTFRLNYTQSCAVATLYVA